MKRTATMICLLAAAGVATAGAGTAWADRPGSAQVGVFGGYDDKPPTNELGNAKSPKEVPQAAAGAGMRVGYAILDRLTAEFEAKYVLSKLLLSGDAAPVLGLRATLRYQLLDLGKIAPFVRVGAGAEHLMTNSTHVVKQGDSDSSTEAGLGSHFWLSDDLALRLDVVAAMIPGRNDKTLIELEGWLGVTYALGGQRPDEDGDGVPDRDDRCPKAKEDPDGFEDADGCPDPDNDGDGVADSADKCPLAKETANGFEDADGCPDDPDSDSDGLVDSKDKCPREAETKNGLQDDDGCPDAWPDADSDGVPDKDDKCPKEPETKNGFEDADGCPDKVPERLQKFSGAIEGIVFEKGSAKIAKSSLPLLTKVVAVLVEFKDTNLEVSGHTDNSGDPEANKKLSLERADAVKAYLVGKGVAAARITTAGLGADKPLMGNDSEAGRSKNRRIEFRLY